MEPGDSREKTHTRDTESPQRARDTSNTRHIETPVLQPAVSVNDAKQLFTAGPDVALPFATRVPSILHLKSLSMTQHKDFVPDSLIRANLPSTSELSNVTHGIVRNKYSEYAAEYYYDNLRPGDNVPCAVRITEGSRILAEGPSQITIPSIPSPNSAWKTEGQLAG